VNIARPVGPALIATALAFGCGEDEPSAGREPRAARSHQSSEYQRRGNALCVAQDRALKRLPPPATPGRLGDYFGKRLAVEQRFDPRFRALKPRPKLRRLHRRLIRLSDRRRPRSADSSTDSRRPALQP